MSKEVFTHLSTFAEKCATSLRDIYFIFIIFDLAQSNFLGGGKIQLIQSVLTLLKREFLCQISTLSP